MDEHSYNDQTANNMRNVQRSIPRPLLLLIGLIALTTLTVYYLASSTDDDDRMTITNTSALFLVDTVGCRMLAHPVFSADIRQHHWYREPPIECEPSALLTHSNADTGAVWIENDADLLLTVYNVTDPHRIACECVPFDGREDGTNAFRINETVRLTYDQPIVLNASVLFARVRCTLDNGLGGPQTIDEYHFFVRPTLLPPSPPPPPPVNVLILGLDTMSRLNFHRQMPLTVDLLLRRLHAVELLGYNKVADNTYPNLVAALTGRSADELSKLCRPPGEQFASCRSQFIWDAWRSRNYTTAFAESGAWLELFHQLDGGFGGQPTAFSLRPLLVELERTGEVDGNMFVCLGGRRTVDIHLAYMRQFVGAMVRANRPFFGLFWSSSYTHDEFNRAQLADAVVASTLDYLRRSGALSNTVVLVMSDHGMRWGAFQSTAQGHAEERQPMLFVAPPTAGRFASDYSRAWANLQTNRRRLTTHYDLYETLVDLMQPERQLGEAALRNRTAELRPRSGLPRGISLFVPVPGERTCDLAGIEEHWCTCHQRRTLPLHDERVKEAAVVVLRHLRAMLADAVGCAALRLDALLGAEASAWTDVEGRAVAEVLVRLRTGPGGGEFEATVLWRTESGAGGTMRPELAGPVSRTNAYGAQSWCVSDALLRLYCYCGAPKVVN